MAGGGHLTWDGEGEGGEAVEGFLPRAIAPSSIVMVQSFKDFLRFNYYGLIKFKSGKKKYNIILILYLYHSTHFNLKIKIYTIN